MDQFSCPYAHIIQSSRCHCEFSIRSCIAEKEFNVCLNSNASKNCNKLYLILKDNSKFIIHNHTNQSLSVSQKNKIKMGGLLALQEFYQEGDLNNIYQLVQIINTKSKQFTNLPLDNVITKIANFKFRM